MQVIKKVLLILYTLILGFIVFCNTSVFGADTVTGLQQQITFETSDSIEQYFINTQDYFDNLITSNNSEPFESARSTISINMLQGFNYFVFPISDVNSINGNQFSGVDRKGYAVYFYIPNNTGNMLTTSENFPIGTFDNYFGEDKFIQYTGVSVYAYRCYALFNFGAKWEMIYTDGQTSGSYNTNCVMHLACLNYGHPIMSSYLQMSNTSGASQITSAIQSQTNTIKEETQKQTNAVVSATQSQTNELLDTNNTGNETMSVNDTTTDTSADLTGLYNSISSAFTTEISSNTTEDFTLTLPNGDNHTFSLKANILTSILNNYPVLKVFYQAFFYVVFCGYVIFDFKRIINKLKEGDIDNVVGSSNPVDSVVNMSLK